VQVLSKELSFETYVGKQKRHSATFYRNRKISIEDKKRLTLQPLAQICGGTGDVSSHFFRRRDIICHGPPFFLFRLCTWRGFKNKCNVCHVLCEELLMLDGRLHIAKFMLKQTLVWYH